MILDFYCTVTAIHFEPSSLSNKITPSNKFGLPELRAISGNPLVWAWLIISLHGLGLEKHLSYVVLFH